MEDKMQRIKLSLAQQMASSAAKCDVLTVKWLHWKRSFSMIQRR
jgi:hypothetical protein